MFHRIEDKFLTLIYEIRQNSSKALLFLTLMIFASLNGSAAHICPFSKSVTLLMTATQRRAQGKMGFIPHKAGLIHLITLVSCLLGPL